MRNNYSFAPAGLVSVALLPHGLRRGLHSDAASRLKSAAGTPAELLEASPHAVSKGVPR